MRGALSFLVFVGLVLLALPAVWPPTAVASSGRAEILAEYGPTAPDRIVHELQQRARQELPQMMSKAMPAPYQGKPWQVGVTDAPRGVSIDIGVEGDGSAAKSIAAAVSHPLEELVQEVGGDYTERVIISGGGFELPSLPRFTLPNLKFPAMSLPRWHMPAMPHLGTAPQDLGRPYQLPGGLGSRQIHLLVGLLLVAVGAVLVLFVLRQTSGRPRVKPLPAPMLWGSPVLGLLPASLARVGKLYHLQSKPCQALGYYFLRQARGQRELSIVAPTAEAAGTVAVCLGLFLVREGEKVLIVDGSSETQVVPSLLTKFGPPGEETPAGQAAGTSIPDLDLLSVEPGAQPRPDLPQEVTDAYSRLLYIPPPGSPVTGPAVCEVIFKATWKMKFTARFSKRLGWVFFGDGVPVGISDRYYTRYYYERLQEESEPAPVPG